MSKQKYRLTLEPDQLANEQEIDDIIKRLVWFTRRPKPDIELILKRRPIILYRGLPEDKAHQLCQQAKLAGLHCLVEADQKIKTQAILTEQIDTESIFGPNTVKTAGGSNSQTKPEINNVHIAPEERSNIKMARAQAEVLLYVSAICTHAIGRYVAPQA